MLNCENTVVIVTVVDYDYEFVQEVRQQLHDDKTEKLIFKKLQTQLAEIKAYLEKGSLVLPFLESMVVHAARCDPGLGVVTGLVLPALEEQVTAKAAKEGHRLRAAAQLQVGCCALWCASQTCIACCGLRLDNVTGLVLPA